MSTKKSSMSTPTGKIPNQNNLSNHEDQNVNKQWLNFPINDIKDSQSVTSTFFNQNQRIDPKNFQNLQDIVQIQKTQQRVAELEGTYDSDDHTEATSTISPIVNPNSLIGLNTENFDKLVSIIISEMINRYGDDVNTRIEKTISGILRKKREFKTISTSNFENDDDEVSSINQTSMGISKTTPRPQSSGRPSSNRSYTGSRSNSGSAAPVYNSTPNSSSGTNIRTDKYFHSEDQDFLNISNNFTSSNHVIYPTPQRNKFFNIETDSISNSSTSTKLLSISVHQNSESDLDNQSISSRRSPTSAFDNCSVNSNFSVNSNNYKDRFFVIEDTKHFKTKSRVKEEHIKTAVSTDKIFNPIKPTFFPPSLNGSNFSPISDSTNNFIPESLNESTAVSSNSLSVTTPISSSFSDNELIGRISVSSNPPSTSSSRSNSRSRQLNK